MPSSGSGRSKTGELQTFVVYDIPSDRLRTQISEACLDYGLERIQYSAFWGSLSTNRRAELFMRLGRLLGDKPGKVMVIALCEKDAKEVRQIVNEEAEVGGEDEGGLSGKRSEKDAGKGAAKGTGKDAGSRVRWT